MSRDKHYKAVSRSAISIRPKKDFINWLSSVDDSFWVMENTMDSRIYLVPVREGSKVKQWLKKNIDSFFDEILSGWLYPEHLWPKKRNYRLFRQWFAIAASTWVYDTQEEEIIKEKEITGFTPNKKFENAYKLHE